MTRPPLWGLALLLAVVASPAMADPPLVLPLRGAAQHDHRPPVATTVAMSDDGTRIAAAGDDHRVRVWDAATGEPLHEFVAHEDWVRAIRFLPEADRLATVGADHAVCVWDLGADEPEATLRRLAAGPVMGVAWRPDQPELATVGFGDRMRRFDLSAEEPEAKEFACPCEDTRAIAYSPEGRWLAIAGRDGVIRLWDLAGSGGGRDLASDGRRIRTLAFAPDGRTLAAGGDGPAVRLWRIEQGVVGETPDELLIRPGKCHALAFVDSQTLAVGGTRNAITVWDTETRRRQTTLTGHTGTVAAMAVSGDGGRLVSGSFDTTVRVWDLASATPPVVAKRTKNTTR